MPITVRAPDGTLVNFPDGMSDGDITRVMRQNYPPSSAAAPKPKPKKKEEESFLSGVIPTFTGAVGDLASTLGLGLQQAAPYLGTTAGIASPLLSLAGALQKDVGKKIKTESDAYLPEASKQERAAQQKFIKDAKPGLGSQALSVFSRAAATNPTVGALARQFLPQTPVEAARSIATVQAPFQTARGASEFVASQLPATLLPMGGGKAVQLVGKRFLPVAGREAAEAALARQVGIGVTTAGGTINAVDAGSQAYADVLAKGGTQEEADRAFKIAAAGAGIVSAAATKIPGLEQLAFAEKPARGGILRSAGRAVIGEAPQEFAEEAGSKLATNVAKLGTAAEVPIGEDVLSSGVLGGIGGGIMAAPLGGLQGLANRGAADDGTPPPPSSSRASRPSAPPPAPPADMEALARALGPVGGKVTLQEPTGPQEYTYQGIDEDSSVILVDADGVVFSEDPAQVQSAIKAGVAEPESGLGGMAFGMDITEGLPDVVAPPPPPPPPPPPLPPAAPKATQEDTTERDTAFRGLASAQRGEPEDAMVAAQRDTETAAATPGYNSYTNLLENVGDLTNRMANPQEIGATYGKIESALVVLKNEADAANLANIPLTPQIETYAAAHAKLPVYNEAQRLARDAAVALGRKDFETARTNLTALKEMKDNGSLEEESSKYDPNFETQAAPKPVQRPVQKPVKAPVAEEPELPAPPPERVRTVTTPKGTKVNTAFEVVDAKDLTAATGDLQNRDRTRASTDLQVQEIFSTFDPERLGESLESDRGSPIIGFDNVIESGNGRVMAINKVYNESPEKADAYRQFIEGQGFDTSGFERPVLVRRRIDRMTPDQRSAFTRESNMDIKLQLSTSEKAQTDAASLTPDVMGLMASPDVSASANQGFVRAFLSKLPAQEQAAFIDKDGRLSSEGIRRLRTAVKSSAYGDADLINTLDESQDNNIKSIGGALEDVAPAWRRMLDAIKEGDVSKEMDTTKQLVEAAKIVRDVRNQGTKIADFLAQDDAFNPLDPITERYIRSFYNETLGRAAGREAIADILDKYARRASEQTTSEGLFESEPMSPAAILDRILDERGSGAGQSNMFASIQPISPKRRAEILDEGGKIPSLSRGIDKLKKLWADGKIDAKEFAFEVASYSNFIEDMKNWKRWEDLGKLKVRGPDRIRSVLLDQKRLGNISEEEANFAEWFILRNENLLNDLGISVVKPPKDSSFSGEYDPLSRVMRLIKGRTNDNTTVHEIMHHLERMMPQDVRAAIKRAWAKELDKVEVLSYEGKNDNDTLFFQAIRAFHNQEQIKLKDKYYSPSSAFKFATDLIASGKVDGRLYQYVNPSEFWAVNATEIMQGRYDVQGSLLGRLKNWLRELSIKIKGLFKLDSNAPIIKALDSLAKSDGKFVSNQMLEDKVFEYGNIRDSKPVTAIAAAAALASSPVSANVNDTPIAPKSALYKSLESGDTKKAIEIIQKSSKNPDARKVASILALNGVGDQKTVILDPVANLDKTIETLSKNGGDLDDISLVTNGDVRGMILSTPKDKTIYLVKNPDRRRNGVNEQTFLHEAIHAYVKARWSSLGVYTKNNQQALDDRGLYNEEVAAEIKEFNDMWRKFSALVEREYDTGAGIPSTVISAAESPNEALSYLLTNESVQKYAKRIVSDGKGYRLMSEKETGKRSWWDDFVDMLRKIFGMGPARDQFFNDFLDAGNSVLASGKKTKADFRVAGVNEESVSPQKVDNNRQAVQAIINGTPDQMRNAVAKAQKPYDKSNEEAADVQSKNRGCD